MNRQTNLYFRGTRDYLHSTTLFNDLVKLDPEPESIDFLMNKETSYQCKVINEREQGNDATLVATYKSKRMTFYIYETLEKIHVRNPCNEKEILSSIAISGTRASCPLPLPSATFIEILVAAYKGLVGSLNVYENQKLVFARLSIDYIPKKDSFVVEHRRTLGKRFFEGNIIFKNQNIGKLIFGSK